MRFTPGFFIFKGGGWLSAGGRFPPRYRCVVKVIVFACRKRNGPDVGTVVAFTLAVKRKVVMILVIGSNLFIWGFACWRVITLKAPRFSLGGAGAYGTEQSKLLLACALT